ncbi:murein transglycosylase A [Hydrogenophilus thermoluteolus]|nr:murein transglycosylase A [Hydrogenophilus thermoluteolus]MBW7657596.1 murein transglycosylase A [Hydrogenophilus thermoluteolus]
MLRSKTIAFLHTNTPHCTDPGACDALRPPRRPPHDPNQHRDHEQLDPSHPHRTILPAFVYTAPIIRHKPNRLGTRTVIRRRAIEPQKGPFRLRIRRFPPQRFPRARRFLAPLLFVATALTGCQTAQQPPLCLPETAHAPIEQPAAPKPVPGTLTAQPSDWAELPGTAHDTLEGALTALARACPTLSNRYREWQPLCAGLPTNAPLPEQRAWLQTHLQPWQLTAHTADGQRTTGLLTGYFEPVIAASRTPRPDHPFPIHAPPPDLVTVALESVVPETRHLRLKGRLVGNRVVPYYSRGEIIAMGTRFPAPVLFWAKDPLDLFFLHIQGSGRLRLAEGGEARIGYADHNGHPYRSIGRLLVARGELPLERASLTGIRAWLETHPHARDALLAENPSYVFFRELPPPSSDPADGPVGALGVPLVAQRSVAVDPRFLPLGAPLWLYAPNAPQPLAQLVVALDTGGAIQGPLRGDFYWGSGHAAGARAGRTKADATWWLLWPRGANPPVTRNAPLAATAR